MYQLIQEFTFQEKPIHIFEYDGKAAFLALEVAEVLGIQNVGKNLRDSKTLERGVDFDVIPANLLSETNKKFVSDVNRITILFLSGFFLYVLRSNKPVAIPFSRWAIREAIPKAFQQKKQEKLSNTSLISFLDQERKGSLYARQILNDHGYKAADPKNKQLTIDGGKP